MRPKNIVPNQGLYRPQNNLMPKMYSYRYLRNHIPLRKPIPSPASYRYRPDLGLGLNVSPPINGDSVMDSDLEELENLMSRLISTETQYVTYVKPTVEPTSNTVDLITTTRVEYLTTISTLTNTMVTTVTATTLVTNTVAEFVTYTLLGSPDSTNVITTASTLPPEMAHMGIIMPGTDAMKEIMSTIGKPDSTDVDTTNSDSANKLASLIVQLLSSHNNKEEEKEEEPEPEPTPLLQMMGYLNDLNTQAESENSEQATDALDLMIALIEEVTGSEENGDKPTESIVMTPVDITNQYLPPETDAPEMIEITITGSDALAIEDEEDPMESVIEMDPNLGIPYNGGFLSLDVLTAILESQGYGHLLRNADTRGRTLRKFKQALSNRVNQNSSGSMKNKQLLSQLLRNKLKNSSSKKIAVPLGTTLRDKIIF